MTTYVIQGYICKLHLTLLLPNAKYFTITNEKNSNYNVTLLRNSNSAKSNVILTSTKYVTLTNQRISYLRL